MFSTIEHPGVQNRNASMNATTFSTHIGLGPSSNVYQQMLQAKMEREQKRNEMLRLEARLKKLQAEEEKIAKRVNDARRQ